LIEHQIDTIVSKNSGGDATYAKIIAARELGIRVVMVKRPVTPAGEQVRDVESAVAWLVNQLR
jgi:precorrin-6A/cobalt-precorrin-6A reductase